MEWLPQLIPVGLMSGLLMLFVRYWGNSIRRDVDKKADKNVMDIHIQTLQGGIGAVNKEVKDSFDKLLEEMKENRKDNGELKVEMARLTQRVDDLVKNGGSNAGTHR